MKLSEEDLCFCKGYDDSAYWHPSLTADSAVFRMINKTENQTKKYPKRKLELLLIKRGRPPYKGGWALPGGFLEKNETLLECAARECQEETGLRPLYQGDVATFSRTDRDPRTRVITQCFLAVVPYGEKSEVVSNDDAAEAEWFEVDMRTEPLSSTHYRCYLTLTGAETEITGSVDLKSDDYGTWRRSIYEDAAELAFDHLEMICCAIESLRAKIYRCPIAFYWLPSRFRLADLQSVYEAVVEKELLRTTFFEHIKPLIRRADEQVANISLLEQIYERNVDYCLEDGLSAIELWRA